MRLPPYAYVPGAWPHPTRDPEGHSYAKTEALALPLDATSWRSNTTWLEGIELFEHGYYWEAHEAWERLWIAAGRAEGGAIAELLSGLIKLAAGALKVRQGKGAPAASLGAKARACFERASDAGHATQFAGVEFSRLRALVDELLELSSASAAMRFKARESEAVVLVFSLPLRLG